MPVSSLPITPQGPVFSRFVYGLWRLGDWGLRPAERLDLIHACLDLGLTTFDHADIYGEYTCEALFGEAMALAPSLREKMQIVTKCGIKLLSTNRPEQAVKHYDTSKAHILASVENSLKALRTDRIDLLLLHRPDPLLDADEVADAFTTLRQTGKVLHFGVSNFTPFQFDLLASRLDVPLITNQVECSVVNFEVMHDGTLDQCQQHSISPMAWSPFGGGYLFRAEDERAVRLRQTLRDVGAQLGGASIDQVALAWLLRHPSNILPILGTGKLERIKTALAAEALTLSRDQWFSIWVASTGTDVP